MLCTRMTVIEDGFVMGEYGENNDENPDDKPKDKKSSSKKIKQVFLPNPPFIVETKWDGERFHIHYDGTRFKFFSKKGFDYAKNFDQTLTPRLKPLIRSGVKSFVVDGEMMAWHKRNKTFTQKGSEIDVKRMNANNQNHCPCFVAFDVLYYNGEILTEKPLSVRSKVLRQILQPKEEVLLLPEQKLMSDKEEVMEALNEAIDNLEEGLIVKATDSKYEPGERPVTWIKIKPEVFTYLNYH
jgi:ATP-dependent DNA ligase I